MIDFHRRFVLQGRVIVVIQKNVSVFIEGWICENIQMYNCKEEDMVYSSSLNLVMRPKTIIFKQHKLFLLNISHRLIDKDNKNNCY